MREFIKNKDFKIASEFVDQGYSYCPDGDFITLAFDSNRDLL